MTNRRSGAWLGLAAVVALGAHALVWRQAEARLQAEWDAWLSRARSAGWRVEAGVPAWRGYPLAAGLDIPRVSIEPEPPAAGPAWHGGLALRVVPWRPGQLELRPRGDQRLGWGTGPAVVLSAARFAATLPLRGDAPRVSIVAGGLRLVLPPAWGGGMARVGDVTLQAQWAEPAALSLRMEAIDLPPDLPTGRSAGMRPLIDALGPRLSSLSLDATLSETGSLPAIPSGPGSPGRTAVWPGRLRIPELALGWGPLGVSGHGEFGLDRAAQPEGRAELRILGAAGTLDALSAHGVIAPGAANAAKGIVALLSRSTEAGLAELDTPVTLGDSTVSVAGIPLARVEFQAAKGAAEAPEGPPAADRGGAQ